MIIPAIHSVRDDIISGETSNILTGAKIRGGDMGFLHRDMLINVKVDEVAVVLDATVTFVPSGPT